MVLAYLGTGKTILPSSEEIDVIYIYILPSSKKPGEETDVTWGIHDCLRFISNKEIMEISTESPFIKSSLK